MFLKSICVNYLLCYHKTINITCISSPSQKRQFKLKYSRVLSELRIDDMLFYCWYYWFIKFSAFVFPVLKFGINLSSALSAYQTKIPLLKCFIWTTKLNKVRAVISYIKFIFVKVVYAKICLLEMLLLFMSKGDR